MQSLQVKAAYASASVLHYGGDTSILITGDGDYYAWNREKVNHI